MSTFVLVHGSWHGAWCWYKVVSRLQARGHTAIALDLPGLGADATPLSEVSLELWNDALLEVVRAQAEPVILVGHSRGGLNISMAAEAEPDRVSKLIYLCAFVPNDGASIMDLAALNTSTRLAENLVPGADGISTTVREDAIEDVFYDDCSADDLALARLCLRPEPLAPLAAPFRGTAANFERIAKAYIECVKDEAISIDTQHDMAARCDEVVRMNTSHSPFFAAPDELVEILSGLAETT